MGWLGNGGADVIPFGKVRADMRFPMVEEVRAYWEALRSGRPVPLRSEVDPRGIERALENTFVLERIAPGVARFRIAGMHLNDLMGMEVRGMPLTAFFTPAARDALTHTLEAVFSDPQIADLALNGERGIGKPPLEGRMLILPLKSDTGEVNRALGCLCSIGPVGRSPRRFELVEQRLTQIGSGVMATPVVRAVSTTGVHFAPEASAAPQAAGFAEQATPFGAQPADTPANTADRSPPARPAKGRPALRLVKSDT